METAEAQAIIEAGDLHGFYTSAAWLNLRASVLQADKNECQRCKARGVYQRANTVHHVNYVRRHPELALSAWYTDGEGNSKRNLISLCHDCHERIHDRRQKRKKFLTEEKW